ncbi:hypothetical protein HMPREF1589_02924 [Escherichia coli 113290]|uniref:Uncharacterized protein n=1 Tax=Escherichia coli TaxID=562 RepID=D9CGU8_ECOLX|nr:hypothetical protein ECAGIv1_0008 [Escherichia coli]ESA68783.1 hypothetical protein HMPREF1589_02924 [Escherichia coli 113290]
MAGACVVFFSCRNPCVKRENSEQSREGRSASGLKSARDGDISAGHDRGRICRLQSTGSSHCAGQRRLTVQ